MVMCALNIINQKQKHKEHMCVYICMYEFHTYPITIHKHVQTYTN